MEPSCGASVTNAEAKNWNEISISTVRIKYLDWRNPIYVLRRYKGQLIFTKSLNPCKRNHSTLIIRDKIKAGIVCNRFRYPNTIFGLIVLQDGRHNPRQRQCTAI